MRAPDRCTEWVWPSPVAVRLSTGDLEAVLRYSAWDPVRGDVEVCDASEPQAPSVLTELPLAELAQCARPSPRRQGLLERMLGATSVVTVRDAHLRFPTLAQATRTLEEHFSAPVLAELHYMGRQAEKDLAVVARPSQLRVLLVLEGELALGLRQSADTRASAQEQTLAREQAVCLAPGLPLRTWATQAAAALFVVFSIERYRASEVVDAALCQSARLLASLRAPVFGGVLAEIAPEYGAPARIAAWTPGWTWRAGVNELADDFFEGLSSLPDGGLAADGVAAALGLDTWVRRRTGAFCSLSSDARVALLRYPGGRLRLRAEALPVLRFIAGTPRFRPRDLPDLLELEARCELTRRLILDGLLRCEG